MDRTTLAIYIQELTSQCNFTRAALEIFNQSAQQQAETAVLFAGQSALTSASQVASILWPTRARARRRGEALREALGLPEKHPFNDRRFSELWENADEKLDRWAEAHKTGRALFDVIAPLDQMAVPDVTEEDIFRGLDPTTNVFYYRGVGYNLNGLSKTVGDIAQRANRVAQQLNRSMEQSDQASG